MPALSESIQADLWSVRHRIVAVLEPRHGGAASWQRSAQAHAQREAVRHRLRHPQEDVGPHRRAAQYDALVEMLVGC